MPAWIRAALAALLIAAVAAGCGGRSHTLEKQLSDQVVSYVQAVTERRLGDAKQMLSGEALAASEVAFPVIEAAKVKQKLLSIEAKAEPVERGAQRAAVEAAYRVESELPGFGTVTEKTRAVYDLAQTGGQWKIFRVAIIESVKENAR